MSTGADDLASSDYRVRMSAALVLGRSTDPSARKTLEGALSDKHPAVRAAAAASLGKIGDDSSQAALRARAETEPDDSVKKQLVRAADAIEGRKAKKLVVQLGSFRNASKAGGANLSKVANAAVRSNAIKFASVVESEDAQTLASAVAKKSRIVRLDGELRSLAVSKQGGVMSVRAQVEFSVLQMPGKTLKGTLSGAATSRNTGESIASLQELAVRGAIESVLANAGPSLLAASE